MTGTKFFNKISVKGEIRTIEITDLSSCHLYLGAIHNHTVSFPAHQILLSPFVKPEAFHQNEILTSIFCQRFQIGNAAAVIEYALIHRCGFIIRLQ